MKRLALSSALLLFKGWNDDLSSNASFFCFSSHFFGLERCHKKVKKKEDGKKKKKRELEKFQPLSVAAQCLAAPCGAALQSLAAN